VVSLLASAIPALEASKIRPNESSREGSFEGRYRRYHKWFSFAGIICIISGVTVSFMDHVYSPFEFPVLAYAGILFIISGFTFISPSFSQFLTSPRSFFNFATTGACNPPRLFIGTLGNISCNVFIQVSSMVDFGTTNTVISFWNNNKSNILNDGIYKTIPSKMFISDKTYCGNYIPLKASNVVHSFKIQKDNSHLLKIFFSHLFKIISNRFSNANEF
jgi:hypothetical protein